MSAQRPPAFRGRSSEREALERLLGDARAGRSAVLVIRGEAGMGKTALMRYAADRASGFRVAQTAGVESEMELPFAGLHQLCAPLLGRLEALPQPQQHALRVALGLAPGDVPDRFLVGLATLSLLAEVAEERPLLCLVDDLQWLDAASEQVLAFVARRLLAEPLVIVFGVREPREERRPAGLPELRLAGLDNEDARALLATVVPGRLDERVRERIIAETRGNPLALLELPRGMSAAELAGGFGGPGAGTQSGLENGFRRRLDGLPADTRRLLRLAAADAVGEPLLVWRAAEQLGIDPRAATPAVDAGLALGIGARVHALASEGDAAERSYRESIECLARTRVRVELARGRLLYGEWLRREGRRVDAREQLRVAHDMLSEIGAELFLSPRTVEWRLKKVFTKLGISSRRALRDALPNREPAPA